MALALGQERVPLPETRRRPSRTPTRSTGSRRPKISATCSRRCSSTGPEAPKRHGRMGNRARRAQARRRRRARRREGATRDRRSSARSATPNCASCTASRSAAGCCSTARPAAASRTSPGPSPASSTPGSSRSRSTTCSTCGSARASATCTRSSRLARRNAPCVLFFDEIDALGRKRSQLNSDAMRTTVNQLLAELDGADTVNEGVFVLAATNHPWDVDTALRRPGRFDRMILVLPPDQPAREAIFRSTPRRPARRAHRPRALARRTEGYSGADIAHSARRRRERR